MSATVGMFTGCQRKSLRVVGTDPAMPQRGTLPRNEQFLPLETLVTREARRTCYGSEGREGKGREVLQTLKWLHVSFLAEDNIRAVFPSYSNMFNSPSSTASPLPFTSWLVLSDGKV